MADDTAASRCPAELQPDRPVHPRHELREPGRPGLDHAGRPNPNFSVGINVGVKKQADDVYAVEITLNAKADREKNVLFNVELIYGGVFRMKNIPESNLAPLLLVECPRLIFPFARQVLATITQQGGFPPLMMEPVDFNAIYLQNLKSLQDQATATPPVIELRRTRTTHLAGRLRAAPFVLQLAATPLRPGNSPTAPPRPWFAPGSDALPAFRRRAAAATAPAAAGRRCRTTRAGRLPATRTSATSASATWRPPISSR